MKWSDDQFQTLKGLVDQGLTARQIGNELGVTRNAIIGKVHRGGLAFSRSQDVEQKTPRKRRRWRPPAAKIVTDKKAPPRATERLKEPESTAKAVTLYELTAQHCRWPVGSVDRMLYCGADQVAGRPYCARHCALAYQRRGAA
jgi:GcrA cell cycle regulator